MTDANEPPTAILVVDENAEGEMLVTVNVQDPDVGDTHAFAVSDQRFEVAGGRLKLKTGVSLDYEQEPQVTVEVTATDAGGLALAQSFLVTVKDVNEAPKVANAIPDQQAEENQTFHFVVPSDTFADVDAGDRLTFTATQNDGSARPAWLDFNGSTRAFDGTPRLGDSGELAVRVVAQDASDSTAGALFTITIARDPNPWQNPVSDPDDRMDVDDNRVVAPLDVLTIVRFINQNGAEELPRPADPSEVEQLYVDVNGDNNCTPLDVLELIAYTNRRAAGESEGSPGIPVVPIRGGKDTKLRASAGGSISRFSSRLLPAAEPSTARASVLGAGRVTEVDARWPALEVDRAPARRDGSSDDAAKARDAFFEQLADEEAFSDLDEFLEVVADDFAASVR